MMGRFAIGRSAGHVAAESFGDGAVVHSLGGGSKRACSVKLVDGPRIVESEKIDLAEDKVRVGILGVVRQRILGGVGGAVQVGCR